MSTTYTYSLASDFTTSHAIALTRFVNDIKNNNLINKILSGIGVDGDVVTIMFTSSLSTSEESVLDTIVANHFSGNPFFDNKAILRDIKTPSGTNGGTFTSGSWQTRDLNMIEGNNVDIWITLSGNSFSLKEGNYKLSGVSSSYGVGDNQTRIFNTTTNTPEFYSTNSTSNLLSQSLTYITGNISVPSGGNSYILQHFCQNTQLDNGFGVSNGFGFSETYSTINIEIK